MVLLTGGLSVNGYLGNVCPNPVTLAPLTRSQHHQTAQQCAAADATARVPVHSRSALLAVSRLSFGVGPQGVAFSFRIGRKRQIMFLKRAASVVLPLAIISVVGVSCTRPSHPFDPARLTAAEKSCYDAINAAHTQEEQAVARKDIDGAMAECSPDYVGTAPDGRTANYAQCRQSMIALFQMSSENKETNAIQDLRLTGDTAVVMVKNHVEATLSFPDPMTGKPMTRMQDHLDQETWVKGPQGWLVTRSDTISSS